MFDSLQTQNLDNLVTDLRNNGGGSHLLCLQLLYYLTDREDLKGFSVKYHMSDFNRQIYKSDFNKFVESYRMEKGRDFVGPDGESIREVQKRATNWLEDELIYNRKLCINPQSLKIAIIGHGNTMRSIFHYIMGFDQRLIYKIGVDNTSISRFIFNSKGWSVVCLNDNSHLKTAPLGTFETRS